MPIFRGPPQPTPLDDAWQMTAGEERPAPEPGAEEAAAAALGGEVPPPPVGLAPEGIAEPAAAAEAPQAATHAPETRPERVVGIVFVHGIGSQAAGETLFDWLRPIVRALWAWADGSADQLAPADRGQDPVDWAQVDLSGGSTPIVELKIPAIAEHDRQRWIVTETWWAADLRPPSISEMIEWLVWRGEVRRIISGIVRGIAASSKYRGDLPAAAMSGDPRTKSRSVGFESAFLGALFLGLAVVAAPIYLIVRALSALPIPQLKDSLSTAQLDWFLSEWFGDVRVLIADRAQAANLRDRLATTIEQVQAYGADAIVVVAHSGGNILTYMTLADEQFDHLAVDTFVGHGEAIGLAWRLGHRGDVKLPDLDWGLRPGDRLLRSIHPGPGSKRPPLRWVDFHATHDPAPAFDAEGWPKPEEGEAGDHPDVFRTIVNRMSVLNDHGGYWENDEEFVIPVLREFDKAGRPDSTSRFHNDPKVDRKRRQTRETRVQELADYWNLWMVVVLVGVIGGLITSLGGGGILALGVGAVDVIHRLSLPIVQVIADIPPVLLGLVIVVGLLAWHGFEGVGAWNELDREERVQALRIAPGEVSRVPTQARMRLRMIGAGLTALMAIAPHPLLLVASVLVGLVTYLRVKVPTPRRRPPTPEQPA